MTNPLHLTPQPQLPQRDPSHRDLVAEMSDLLLQDAQAQSGGSDLVKGDDVLLRLHCENVSVAIIEGIIVGQQAIFQALHGGSGPLGVRERK